MNPARVVTPGVLLQGQTGRVSSATRAARGRLELVAAPHDIPIRLSFSARSAIGDDNHPVGIGPPICPGGRPLPIGGPRRNQRRRMAHGVMTGSAACGSLTAGTGVPPPQPVPYRPDEPQPGHEQLRPREREVLRMIAAGLLPKQVADALQISPNTVSNHIASIYAKTGGSTELGALALRRQLVS